MNNFWPVLLASSNTPFTIELLQPATRFRSADIDHVILNIAGAVGGFFC
jgi:glycopeptide antibiotics resistance protein